MKWVVGAFEEGKMLYRASIPYADRRDAELYCAECERVCAPTTRKEYKVVEVPDEDNIHYGKDKGRGR